MATTCTLGSLDLNDGVAFRLAGPPQLGVAEHQWREVAGLANSRQVASHVRKLVEMRFPIKLLGADIDARLTNMASLREQLPTPTVLASNTLTYCRHDSAASRSATVLYSPQAEMPDDLMSRICELGYFDLVLIREPFWYESEITAKDAVATTMPGLVDLGTIVGDYPAPLEITIDRGGSADLHCAHCGLLALASSLAWADLYKEGEDLTWYSGTATAGPTTNQSASASKKNASVSYSIAEWGNTRAYDLGSYVPLIRCAILDTSETGTFKWLKRVGWAAGYDETDIEELAITGAGFDQTRWLEFLPVRLPVARALSATGLCNLWIAMKSSSAAAGDEAVTDAAALVPTAWGYAAWHPAAYGDDCDVVTFKPDGTVYVDDLEHYADVRAPGPILAPPGAAKLAIVADLSGAASSLSADLTVKYTPRYAGV